MKLEDLEQVCAIDELSFSLPWPKSAFRYELVDNPLSYLLVAEARSPDGQRPVVGMIVIWMVVDEAHIATIAVHPQYRGLGIGSELLVAGLREAIQRGCLAATLEVRVGNLRAQSLYQRFGFKLVGRRPRYYRDNNEDALIMTVNQLGPSYLDWLERRGWEK